MTRELQALGATVTNVLPLAEGQSLRFWVSDYRKNEVLQQLRDAGYTPTFIKMEPQVDTASYSIGLVNVFEVRLPAERHLIPDDRIPKGEVINRDHDVIKREAQKMIEHIYGKQR